MSVDEARFITLRINSTIHNLALLLKEAHDRKAWKALGYSGFREYVEAETQVSRQRAYQLLRHTEIVDKLALAAGVTTAVVTVSERATRGLDAVQVDEVCDGVRQAVLDDGSGVDRVEVIHREIDRRRPAGPATSTPESRHVDQGSCEFVERAVGILTGRVSRATDEVADLLRQISPDDFIGTSPRRDRWRSELDQVWHSVHRIVESLDQLLMDEWEQDQ